MSSSSFRFTWAQPHVLVVTVRRLGDEAEWRAYEQEYTRIFQTATSQFVLVFDVRELALPGLAMIQCKRRLTQSLKHITLRLVLATVVITRPELCDFIRMVVQTCGQTSPFYPFSTVRDAASRIARLVAIIQNTPGAEHSTMTKTPAWRQMPRAALIALITLKLACSARLLVTACQLAKPRAAALGSRAVRRT